MEDEFLQITHLSDPMGDILSPEPVAVADIKDSQDGRWDVLLKEIFPGIEAEEVALTDYKLLPN